MVTISYIGSLLLDSPEKSANGYRGRDWTAKGQICMAKEQAFPSPGKSPGFRVLENVYGRARKSGKNPPFLTRFDAGATF
jgi:hypothetical protein